MGKVEERIKKAKERYERLKSSKNKGFITKDGKLVLKEGTLIHGTEFMPEVLEKIANTGLIGKKFISNNNVHNSADWFPNGVNFFRVPKSQTMEEYFRFYIYCSGGTFKEREQAFKELQEKNDGTWQVRGARIEAEFLPNLKKNDKIAFIINPSTEINNLMQDDPYVKRDFEVFGDETKSAEQSPRGAFYKYDKAFGNKQERIGNILYGIPASQISGILISNSLENNRDAIMFLQKVFPDQYITRTDGRVIYKGVEKEEKNNELMEETDIIEQSMQAYSRIGNSAKQNSSIVKKNGKLYLQEGTLVHGVSYDTDVLKSISKKGLVAPEFIENAKKSNNESEKVVMFYRVSKSQTMSEYTEFCSERLSLEQYNQVIEHESFSVTRPMSRVENDFIPNNKFNKDKIAFIINPSDEVGELFQYDAFKEKDTRLLGGAAMSKFSKIPERIATTVYGVPQNMISGILVPKEISKDIEKMNQLKDLFPDKFITTPEGELIYEPQKEISKKEEIRKHVFNPSNVISSANMQRNIKLGNTGEMHRYVAADGSKYLVKPAYKKGTKQQEKFRAAVQRAAYEVQKMIDPSSAVACNIKKLNTDGQTIVGTVQEEIDGTNFDDISGIPSEKFQQYGSQFLREFVTDYLLCNYDTHGGNYIVDKNGVLRGIDKEESFEFIMEDSTDKIYWNGAPDGTYTVYDDMFALYMRGNIDLNLEEIFTYLDRIDKIPDDVYMSKFKLYASLKANNSEEEKEILERILARKQNAGNNIKEFLINIKIQRKANELGITPEEVRGIMLKKIASRQTERDVGAGTTEMKSNYIEHENPSQIIENNVSLDEQ